MDSSELKSRLEAVLAKNQRVLNRLKEIQESEPIDDRIDKMIALLEEEGLTPDGVAKG